MDMVFWEQRILALKTQIVAYEDAILAFGANGAIQSYTLDTGQTRQIVTRADLRRLNDMRESLWNSLTTLENRLYGGNVTVARPHF